MVRSGLCLLIALLGVSVSAKEYDSCKEDNDCEGEFWCRMKPQHGIFGHGKWCVPYSQLGEKCEGRLIPPDQIERCGPGLHCTPWPPREYPGHCVKDTSLEATSLETSACSVCQDLATMAQVLLQNDKSISEVSQFAESMCSQAGEWSDTCLSITHQLEEQVMELSKKDVGTLCQQLSFC